MSPRSCKTHRTGSPSSESRVRRVGEGRSGRGVGLGGSLGGSPENQIYILKKRGKGAWTLQVPMDVDSLTEWDKSEARMRVWEWGEVLVGNRGNEEKESDPLHTHTHPPTHPPPHTHVLCD